LSYVLERYEKIRSVSEAMKGFAEYVDTKEVEYND
jgi:hypothetical protein